MMTGRGPFGPAEMGGMFTLLKVRRGQKPGDYTDRAWFRHPAGSVAHEFTGELPAPSRQPASAPAGRRRRWTCASRTATMATTDMHQLPIQLSLAALCAGTLLAPAWGHGDSAGHPPARAVKEQKPWGIAGDAKRTRTVTLRMGDDMRFPARTTSPCARARPSASWSPMPARVDPNGDGA